MITLEAFTAVVRDQAMMYKLVSERLKKKMKCKMIDNCSLIVPATIGKINVVSECPFCGHENVAKDCKPNEPTEIFKAHIKGECGNCGKTYIVFLIMHESEGE